MSALNDIFEHNAELEDQPTSGEITEGDYEHNAWIQARSAVRVIGFQYERKGLYGEEFGRRLREEMDMDLLDHSPERVELVFPAQVNDWDDEFILAFMGPTAKRVLEGKIPLRPSLYGPYLPSLPEGSTPEQFEAFANGPLHRMSRVLTDYLGGTNRAQADKFFYAEKTVGGRKEAPKPPV